MFTNLSKLFFLGSVLVAPIFGFGPLAHAEGLQLGVGISYIQSSDQLGAGTKTTSTNSFMDLRGNYHFANGLFLGLKYIMDQYETKTEPGTTSIGKLTGYGPTLGFEYNTVYASFTHVYSTEYVLPGGSKYNDGTGTIVDLGINLAQGSFRWGPYFSIRNYNYKKLESSGVSTAVDYKFGQLTPYLGLGYAF